MSINSPVNAEPRPSENLFFLFLRLVVRAGAGIANVKTARCARCGGVKRFRLAKEIQSTGEDVFACESCQLLINL